MTADYAALEARVTELEHQIRNVLPQKIDAVAYGLSLVHGDVREIRRVQDEHGLLLRDLAEGQRRQGRALERHDETLSDLRDQVAEVLRRLPPADEG